MLVYVVVFLYLKGTKSATGEAIVARASETELDRLEYRLVIGSLEQVSQPVACIPKECSMV